MQVETKREYCNHCLGSELREFRREVRFSGIEFAFHLFMTFMTLGFWLVIWAMSGHHSTSPWICQTCGNPESSKWRADLRKSSQAMEEYREKQKLARAMRDAGVAGWEDVMPKEKPPEMEGLIDDPRNNRGALITRRI